LTFCDLLLETADDLFVVKSAEVNKATKSPCIGRSELEITARRVSQNVIDRHKCIFLAFSTLGRFVGVLD